MRTCFAILCFDRPNAGELREKTRPAHNAYLKAHAKQMHVGGPFESDEGASMETLLIVNVQDRAAALAFTENELFSHKRGRPVS